MKKSKNLKGFTLVEEVVSLFILSILILVASGMMISAMRVYSVNVKTQSAQNKGQYVYDLLSNKLTYSSGLQYETNGVFEPTNATYYEDREVKGVFDESEIYQEIAVDKNGITKGFKGETATERVEFAPYDVEVLLEAETAATSESVAPSASASADNSMNDEALFNLVSNSEVTDSAGYLIPQGEVSFLGGLEIMNQSAEVRTVATAGVDCTFDSSNMVDFRTSWDNKIYKKIDISKLSGKVSEIIVHTGSESGNIQLYNSSNESWYNNQFWCFANSDVTINDKEYIDELNSKKYDSIILWFSSGYPEYISFYDKDGKLLDANANGSDVKPSNPLEIDINGVKYHSGDSPRADINFGSTLNIESNKSSQIEKITFTNNKDWWLWSQNYKGDGYFSVTESDKLFSLTANSYNDNNSYYVTIKSGNEQITVQVNVLPFPLSVTIDGEEHYDDFSINIEEGERKEVTFNTDSKDLKKICYYTDPAEIYTDKENEKIYLSGKKQGQTTFYFEYGGKKITVTVNITKPEDPFNIIPTKYQYLVVNDNDTSNTANKGFQILTNKTENGSLTENAKKTYDKIEYYFVDDDGNKIESDLAEISETGYVIAKKAGTVKICATAIRKDGKADEVSTNKVTISVSEPISVSPSEITVFAGDEFNSLPFKVENSNNYESVNTPWGITFNDNGMQVNKDFNDNSTVTITFRDRSNNSTAKLTINIVKFKILNLTDNNINLQKGKSLKFESNYGQSNITNGTKTFSIEIGGDSSLLTDESSQYDKIYKIVKASEDKTGQATVKVKFGGDWIQTYSINVVEKERTLKIDNSENDRNIKLWAGETRTFTLSSTLEGFNDVYVENSDSSVLSYTPKKNGDGTYTLNVIAGKPARDTVVTLTVYDRCYLVNDDKSVTDEKGLPIRITITIKVPTVDTNSITVYKGGDSVRINTYDTPLDKLTWDISSTDISVEKRTDGIDGIYVTGINKTSSPVTLKLTYNFNDVTYEFDEIRVTVNENSVAPSESPSEAPPANSSAVSSSKTTTGTTCTGEPISKYRFRLTVTVKDKKGREIYERSGSVSVMNYDVNRYPTLSKINFKNTDNGGNGFKLRIYYVD